MNRKTRIKVKNIIGYTILGIVFSVILGFMTYASAYIQACTGPGGYNACVVQK